MNRQFPIRGKFAAEPVQNLHGLQRFSWPIGKLWQKKDLQLPALERIVAAPLVIPAADGKGPPEPAAPDESTGVLNRALIGDAMAQLSAEHRAVVGRSYYQGWTTAQIAADLGIAEGTVKSRLHYALRGLRQALVEMGVTQ